ncbi:MAG: APC family permease, partial [Thermoleophilia bacterium]|nr:APC family permease [Thermoleophilia bacterium]
MARRRRQESLGRVVGIGGLLGTAYGDVGTSVYFALGAIALYALGVTPFLIVAVGLVFIVTAWSYAEGSAALPEASGVTSFARRAFDPMTGFAAAWALLLDSAVIVAIACSAVPHYLGALWPQLQMWPYDLMVGAGVLVLVIVLNVFGLQESFRLSSLMAVLGLATLVLLLIVGSFAVVRLGALWSQIDLGATPTWASLLSVVPLAAATFLGLDAVSSRAESALRPGRDVPLAINVVLPVIIALSAGLGVVALSALPVAFNTVPVDRATGLTVPVAVVPGDEPGGYVLAGDPAVAVVVPVRKDGDSHVIPAQEPTGPVVTTAAGVTTKLYGTLLGTTYLQDPVMGLVHGLPADLDWLEQPLRVWVAIVVAIALVLMANAVVGGSGRILYSLARHHQVPSVLGRVHFSRMTPYVGIILFGVVAGGFLLPRDPLVRFGFFGFGAMIAFTLTHLSVIALRYREASLPRPFVVPLNIRWHGGLLPVPA